MTPENIDPNPTYEYKKSLNPNESILLNNQYGIFFTNKHNMPHISLVDGKTMARKTEHLNESETLCKSLTETLTLTASQGKDKITTLTIKSEKPLQVIWYSFIQDFDKLFEHRREKGQPDTIPSSEDNPEQ